MPRVFYVKFTDLGKSIIDQYEFFFDEKEATRFREELREERNEQGGPKHSDIWFSEVRGFQYRDVSRLLEHLNELKDIAITSK